METFDNPRRREELRQVIEHAAEWFTLFEEGPVSPAERAAFSKWMTESPLHVRAFLNVSAVDRMVESVDPERRLAIVETDAEGGRHGIATLNDRGPRRKGMPDFRSRHRRLLQTPWLTALAATIFILLAASVWQLLADLRGRHIYSTAIGEQRSIELNDGSLVHLNARSHLEVDYSAQGRDLRLREGEALFKVEHDAQKPFRVHVGDSIVQALGTQFDIDRREDRTTVSVLDGVVQVSKVGSASAAAPMKLTAGQSVDIAADGKVAAAVPAKIAQVTAWQQRKLVFDEDTLADIAAEFNRYNRVPQLRVEGETVRHRRYAAVFDADNPQPFLLFLKKDRELAFEARGDEVIIRPREYQSAP